MKAIVMLIAVLLFGVGLVGAHGETVEGYNGHHEGMMSSVFGMGVFGWIFLILIVVLLVLLIVWLVKQLQSKEKKRERRRKRK